MRTSSIARLIGAAALTALIGAMLYLLLWPIEANPHTWQPTAAQPVSAQPQQSATRVLVAELQGPAKLVPHFQGKLATGLSDGRIVVFDPASGGVKPKGSIAGRPRGLQTSSSSGFVVAEPDRGILGARKHRVPVVSNGPEGSPVRQALDVAIDPQGLLWFVDASARWPAAQAWPALVEHAANGRLLRFDDRDRSTSVALSDLAFPAGLALSHAGDALLISELAAHRIRRYWLSGPRAGQSEILLDGLPGYPAHISHTADGRYWVALMGPRLAALQAAAQRPWLARVLLRLPPWLRPELKPRLMAIAINDQGRILQTIDQAVGEGHAPITSVIEHDSQLLFASPWADGLWVLPQPVTPQRK